MIVKNLEFVQRKPSLLSEWPFLCL